MLLSSFELENYTPIPATQNPELDHRLRQRKVSQCTAYLTSFKRGYECNHLNRSVLISASIDRVFPVLIPTSMAIPMTLKRRQRRSGGVGGGRGGGHIVVKGWWGGMWVRTAYASMIHQANSGGLVTRPVSTSRELALMIHSSCLRCMNLCNFRRGGFSPALPHPLPNLSPSSRCPSKSHVIYFCFSCSLL